MTDRRAFVSALALAILAAPLATEAQPAGKVYRVGELNAAYALDSPMTRGLKNGLEKLGFHEGRNVTYLVRFTEGSAAAMPAAATALVEAGVDVIVTAGEAATRAAMAATDRVPIVFQGVGDPVSAGIVADFARPGGNVTGVSSLYVALAPKRLEILKDLVPALRRVWAIYPADDPQSRAAVQKVQEAAPRLGLELLVRPVRTPAELALALESVQPGDGLLALGGPVLDTHSQTLNASLAKRAPATFPAAFWLSHGALASYGPDFYAVAVQAARLVAKILGGARPRDLPVEGANRIEFGINLKTAKRLGIEIPRDVLIRADRVVQ